MTISSILNRTTLTGNGVSTAIAISFPFDAASDLVVLSTVTVTGVQTLQLLTTNYTITGTPDALGHYPNGGTVTMVTAPATGIVITVYRDPAKTQGLSLQDNSKFPASSIEAQLDYVIMLIQRLSDRADRALAQPDGDNATVVAIPSTVTRSSKYFGFDSNGNPVALGAPANTTAVAAFMAGVLVAIDAPSGRVALGMPNIAKGSLIGASAVGTLAEQLVGADGQFLQADSSQSTGIKWNAPALGNPILNGNMDIWQRGTSFAAASPGQYTADRWRWNTSGAGVVTVSQDVSVPTVAQAGLVLNYSLKAAVTTADTSGSSTRLYSLEQRIEGFNWKSFAQLPFTVSFWVRGAKVGVHSVGFLNGVDRYYIAEYSIIAPNTWERKTLAIPASPSLGTWGYTTGIGLQIIWVLSAGSNVQAAPGTWSTGALYATNNVLATNELDTIGNTFQLTGVKLELGTLATPIQYRSVQDELTACQRYYEKSYDLTTQPGASALNLGDAQKVAINVTDFYDFGITRFAVSKRATPTIASYNPSTGAVGTFWDYTGAATLGNSAVGTMGQKQFHLSCANSALVGAHAFGTHWTADAEL